MSKTTTQPKNSNLIYMIDPMFWNINRLLNRPKLTKMILQETLVLSITCHMTESKIFMC